MLKVNRVIDKIGPLKNDRGEIIMKDEQICTVLKDYFLSIFTKEDVENVPISQQMFHGTENDQLLDIVIKKDMVQQKLAIRVRDLMKFIRDY